MECRGISPGVCLLSLSVPPVSLPLVLEEVPVRLSAGRPGAMQQLPVWPEERVAAAVPHLRCLPRHRPDPVSQGPRQEQRLWGVSGSGVGGLTSLPLSLSLALAFFLTPPPPTCQCVWECADKGLQCADKGSKLSPIWLSKLCPVDVLFFKQTTFCKS